MHSLASTEPGQWGAAVIQPQQALDKRYHCEEVMSLILCEDHQPLMSDGLHNNTYAYYLSTACTY